MTESWMNTQLGDTASVPQSAPATQGADPYLDIIKNISTPIDPALIRAATSPIPGSHAQAIPSNLTTPIAPHQDRPLNTTPVVGRKAARIRGIGNAFTGATNALGAIVTKEAQVKQNQIRDAAQKVIMAQQGIDEARQAHDAAIKNGDAETASKMQALIQQNQQARDAVFSDPKMRKALQKGFNINYTDPSENKTEEHAAVQEALKNARTIQEKRQAIQDFRAKQNAAAGAAFGQAFEKAQPQALTQNVQAQQQLQYALSNQAIQQQAMKDYMNFKASIYRSDRTVDAARVRQLGAGILQAQRLQFQQDAINQRFAQAQQLLGERFDNETKLVGMRLAASKNLVDYRNSNPLAIYNSTRKAAQTYQRNLIADSKALTDLQLKRQAQYFDKNGNAISDSKVDHDEVQNLDKQIQLVKQAIQNDQQNLTNFTNHANNMADTFGLNEPSSDTGFEAGGESDSAGDTDYTDPINYLNQSDQSEQQP